MKTTYNYATHQNETWYSKEEIEPFLDSYFNGLDFKTIAELAKKSIRITAENRKLEETLEEIKNFSNEECENECGFCWCKGTTDKTTCVIFKIKNKINEALKDV